MAATAATPSEESAFLRDARDLLLLQSKPDSGRLLAAMLDELQARGGSKRRRPTAGGPVGFIGGHSWTLLLCVTVAIYAYSASRGFVPSPRARLDRWLARPCWYKAWMFLLETSRYPSRCQDTCGGLTDQVEVEYYGNLTKERFARVYRDPARPVIVRNATHDWPAMTRFNLSFFRDLYDKHPNTYSPHHLRNKLLPFRLPPRYRKLRDAFHMSEEDQAKPWYFGWSNVDLNVHWELQKYYRVPDFLPDDTEYGQMEWFFMGTSQEAAYLHIDHTVKPAWQAQIRGRKVWELHPPAECMLQCSPIKAHLQDGDIFVIDPSIWYHGTFVHPGELSITFGMEYA